MEPWKSISGEMLKADERWKAIEFLAFEHGCYEEVRKIGEMPMEEVIEELFEEGGDKGE